jgi:hypothetical protein
MVQCSCSCASAHIVRAAGASSPVRSCSPDSVYTRRARLFSLSPPARTATPNDAENSAPDSAHSPPLALSRQDDRIAREVFLNHSGMHLLALSFIP